MCGIAGILGRRSNANRAALECMSRALHHRGPDGRGVWEGSAGSGAGGVLLAHRRLAILDLSDAGAQPMVDLGSGAVISFNGEIYNFAELRTRLSDAGEQFRSSGDTEVILRALSIYGPRATASFRGMFAFAYWDVRRQQLLLARDPMGIKPLYFARNADPSGEWSLIFASEVRAILAAGLLDAPRLNPQAVASVVWNGFVTAPDTAVRGVETLWPGQLRVFDGSGQEQHAQFYAGSAHHGSDAAVDDGRLSEILRETVQCHLISDVPVAVFLSGGVDSSAIANIACRASESAVHTFTLAFEEKEYDESDSARRVAAALGTQHQELVLTQQQFNAHLDAAVDSLDQPTFDGINSYYMSRAVRAAGFKVALVGTGGDELFGGYTSFRELPRLLRWSRRAQLLPAGLRRTLARALASALQPGAMLVSPQTRWAKLPDMLDCDRDLLALYQLAYALFLPEFQRELLESAGSDRSLSGLDPDFHARLEREARAQVSTLAAISVLEQRLFLGERLLRDTDAVSMTASLEVRLPLVDHVLCAAVQGMRDDERFQPLGRKAALRRSGLAGLDPALFERPKRGFVLPYARWLRSGLGARLDSVMLDRAAVAATGLNPRAVERLWQAFQAGAPGVYWSRVWALYVLVRWSQRNGVTI